MFNSTSANFVDLVDKYKDSNKLSGNSDKNINHDPINVISINIGESMHNVPDGVIPFESPYFPSGSEKSPDQTANFIRYLMKNENSQFFQKPGLLPRNISIDTLGEFGNPSAEWLESVIDEEEGFKQYPLYARSSLVGTGNPMRLLRYLSIVISSQNGSLCYAKNGKEAQRIAQL